MPDQLSQSDVVPPDDQSTAPASGAEASPTVETPWYEGVSPEQYQEYREAYNNQHRWSAENTQRAQQVAEQQRALEAAQRQFYSDPINRQIHEIRQQLYNPDGTVNEQRLAQLERLSGSIAQGGNDPLVTGLSARVRQLEGFMQQTAFSQQQAQQEALIQAGIQEAEQFRAGLGADEFPDTPEGDIKFQAFMENEYPKMGTDRIENAYRLARWDQLSAGEREKARATMTDQDMQAREAGSGIQPGAHEPPPPVEGDPTDWGFRGAQERCLQQYSGVDYETGE